MSCEVFDSDRKAKPPIPLVEHPVAMSRDESSARTVRKWAILAVLLILWAPVLFWWNHRANGTLGMPTFVGVSLILAAARLLDWNMARKELLQQERQRIQAPLIHERDSSGTAQ